MTREGSWQGGTVLSVSYYPRSTSSNDKEGICAESESWSRAGRVHPYDSPFQALEA